MISFFPNINNKLHVFLKNEYGPRTKKREKSSQISLL